MTFGLFSVAVHVDDHSLGRSVAPVVPAQPNDRLCLLLRTCFTWLCVRVPPHNKRNLFVSLVAVSDFLFSTSIVVEPPPQEWRPFLSMWFLGWVRDRGLLQRMELFRQSFANLLACCRLEHIIGVSNNKSGFRRENRHKGDNIRRYQIQGRDQTEHKHLCGTPVKRWDGSW